MAKPVYLISFLSILFACEEDVSTLGFKSEQNGLKVYYVEIPIKTSVLLMDSLRTSPVTGETYRLLAGSYADPLFGSTHAQANMHYSPSSLSTVIPENATYDSIVFKMRFDFYTYGASGTTNQSYTIYELADELNLDEAYFFNSPANVDVTTKPLASVDVDVNATFFKEEFDDTDTDSVLTIRAKLSDSFGQRLFNAVDPEDINYTDFEIFKTKFKGLAIVPNVTDKIVGLSPTDLNSSLTIYYHDGSTAKSLVFNFAQGITFSKITSDRSATELAGLTEFHTDFDPGLNRHVQAGTSIITKLDLTKFYDYMDTIDYVIINSAELSLPGVEPASVLTPPSALSLSMLKGNNRFKELKTYQDTLDYVKFNGMLLLGDQAKFFAAGDQGGVFPLNYSSTDSKYAGSPTLFIQKLFDLKEVRYPYWALRPLTPQPGKAVDRVVFPKENIKLKLYYTRALLEKK